MPPATAARTITPPPFLIQLLRAYLDTHNHPHMFVTAEHQLLRRSTFAGFGVHDGRVSFDLVVLAAEDADDAAIREMVDRCSEPNHTEGELDERVAGFYERLRGRFPDDGEVGADSPWMSTPLSVGIDHVFMSMSWSERGSPAIEAVVALAGEFGLVVFDPQSGHVVRP
ncbi:hypothetical protein [Amycolatopsis sp. GM8]|uniref:hypothetical protein n=1 Tax=Amycolatopsis sp. GM8 TaxID=2896530 RepID=UPI001F27E87A|nr:hypothetical protein [Amycolatopsis sp. GM8]